MLWKFFPASVHGTTGQYLWARNLWDAVNGVTTTWVDTHAALTVTAIMSQSLANGQPAHRCFPGGDPHLVAVERNAIGGGVSGQIGGDATTFTGDAAAGATKGHWKKWGGAIDPRLAAKRPYDASYLYPIYRGQNPGSKGVIHLNGTVGISGLLRGRVTLYSSSWIVILARPVGSSRIVG